MVGRFSFLHQSFGKMMTLSRHRLLPSVLGSNTCPCLLSDPVLNSANTSGKPADVRCASFTPL